MPSRTYPRLIEETKLTPAQLQARLMAMDDPAQARFLDVVDYHTFLREFRREVDREARRYEKELLHFLVGTHPLQRQEVA